MDDFQKLEYWAKKHVQHYRSRLLPDHVRAAYLCSPHTDVIKHAVDPNNLDSEDRMACERLLKKLMVPAGIVSEQERERVEAEVIDTFLTELELFQTKSGPFSLIICGSLQRIQRLWHMCGITSTHFHSPKYLVSLHVMSHPNQQELGGQSGIGKL